MNYKAGFEENLIKMIIDLIALKLRVPIGMFVDGKPFFTDTAIDSFSCFCKELKNSPELWKLCEADHSRRALECDSIDTKICHAGLFNQLNTRVHFIGKNIGLSPSMN